MVIHYCSRYTAKKCGASEYDLIGSVIGGILELPAFGIFERIICQFAAVI